VSLKDTDAFDPDFDSSMPLTWRPICFNASPVLTFSFPPAECERFLVPSMVAPFGSIIGTSLLLNDLAGAASAILKVGKARAVIVAQRSYVCV
jgi:hypothetical protein